MEWTNANWITLTFTLVGIAGTWGGILVRMARSERDTEKLEKFVDEKLREFSSSRDKQGERLGGCEKRLDKIQGADEAYARVESVLRQQIGARERRKTMPPSGGGGTT